jgi:ribosome-associated protein
MAGQQDLRVRAGLVIPAGELHEAATRSSGPGGQHVNKTSTRVTIRWSVAASAALSGAQRRRLRSQLGSRITRAGDLVVHCDRTRSRARNREIARDRLVEIVSGALARQKPRRATRPSKASRVRRVDAKTRRGAIKQGRGPVRSDSD